MSAVADPEPAVFAALADPTRWRMLGMLAQRGEGTATTLAAELPVSRPAVIKHLTVLDHAGLVSRRRAGREVRYRVEPARLDATARRIADLAAAWDTRLAALKALAETRGDVMDLPPIVSPDEWAAAREALLVKEKELTRARDALAAERRRMPRMAVEKDYRFEGPDGPVGLLDLFEGRRQLIVYRYFFEPGVPAGRRAAAAGARSWPTRWGTSPT